MAGAFKALLILSLVGLNAFFAAAEYALLSVRRTRLELLADRGDHRARQALALLADPGLLISGTQLGVTVVSLLMGWLGEGIVAGALEHSLRGHLGRFGSAVVAHSLSIGIALLLITALLMVLGELVPKGLAYARAEQVALLLARPMLFFLRLSRIPVGVLDRLGGLVLRGVGPTPAQPPQVARHTLEEVKLIVSGIRRRGWLGEEQEEMIHSVFDLHRVLVREIMVPRPRVVCLPVHQNLNALLEQVVEDQHSRIPIYERLPDHIIGILYTKDLLRVVYDRLRQGVALEVPFDLRSILHQPMIVPETMPLSRMLEEARSKQAQMAMVVDEFGTFVGLVTIEDVLEEIVGEIQDEYDREEKVIQKVSEDVLVFDAAVSLRELADQYDIVLPRGRGYETLAGFVLARLKFIPKGGESFVFEGRRYTALEMAGRRIARVRVERLPVTGPAVQAAAHMP